MECLKSWTYEELINTGTPVVAVTEEKLGELTKHVGVTEASGNNVRDK